MPRQSGFSWLLDNPYKKLEEEQEARAWAIGEETDRFKATNPEMQRQARVLARSEETAAYADQRDREESDAVRSARNRGFRGTYPLREQEEDAFAKLMRPQELARETANAYRLADREDRQQFQAEQNALGRGASMDRTRATQQGQNQRLAERSADIAARGVKPRSNILRSLFGMLPGVDSNQEVQMREAEEMRNRVRGQMAVEPATADTSGTVKMIDPNNPNEIVLVPADQVEMYRAKGAQVVD